MKKKFLFVLLFISNIISIIGEDEKRNDYNDYIYNDIYRNNDNINVVSISYELTYDNNSVVKVIIKAYDEIVYNINFKAYLKSDDEKTQYVLNCSNSFYDTIECLSERNITIDTQKKYFFYYSKGEKDKITFDEKNIYEDNKKISFIFKPEISDKQILFKDHRTLQVKTDMEVIGGGYLYIVRQSKKILQKPKCGFNKYIELNNFISHCGLMGYRPQSTLIAYEEAIRRGYHIVDADLMFTKDKIPVLYHGDEIDASNGVGKISSKTLEELEKLDLGVKFDKKYKGEKILTFEKLLELCKENDVIIDLDLAHLTFEKYFNHTNGYMKIMLNLIEKYDMFDSIFFNDKRPEVILKLKELKNDLSFSLNGMNEKENIEKIKDDYKGSKRIIYNMGGLAEGQTIKEDVVKYGLSLGHKIKASKVDDIEFAQKIQSWGVNYITTNYIHPFLIKNEKEEPIVIRCVPSAIDEYDSEC